MTNMTRSVPGRWLKYKPFGEVIKGTKILAFKAPLKATVANNLKPHQRFTPATLLTAYPHLKYIIDLTNTCRYYDNKEFTNVGIVYQKITVPGKKVPDMDVTKKFFKVMDDFMSTCGEDDLIGVHCTHGVNRTGYLICRYLIQQLGWEIKDSLSAFREARGYKIERGTYIGALSKLKRGEKIDTTDVDLTAIPIKERQSQPKRKTSKQNSKSESHPKRSSSVTMPRRGFANEGPFPPQRYGFMGPQPGFRPPPPCRLPIPPPMGPPPYSPRPLRYGPPMRPAMPPSTAPRPRFPPPDFMRMPTPPRMSGPPRLPPGNPFGRSMKVPPVPPPPPPPPPPLPPSSSSSLPPVPIRMLQSKRHQIRIGLIERAVSLRFVKRNDAVNRFVSRVHKEQDFTVDTFEENLLTSSVTVQARRKSAKGRFNRGK